MSDLSDRFLDAITELEAVSDGATADEARAGFDAPTLQVFWRDWPHISSWAGALWLKINEDIEQPAKPAGDSDHDEVGGEGG